MNFSESNFYIISKLTSIFILHSSYESDNPSSDGDDRNTNNKYKTEQDSEAENNMYEDAITDVNFSDDEDAVEAIVNAKAVIMELAQNSTSKVNIHVSSPFYNPTEDTTSYIVIHGKAEKKMTPFYYYKEELQKSLATTNQKKFILHGKYYGVGEWIKYMTNYKIRRNPHDEDSKYKRNDKGYPVDMFGYAVKVKGRLSNDDILKEETLRFMLFFKEPVKTEDRALTKCKAILKTHKDAQSHNLYKWLVERKGNDEERAAQNMAKEVSSWFCHGAIFHKEMPLDQFMVDYDIRSFLIEHLSCGGWNDINDSDKKHCFKHYPRKQLPDWESITKEDYQLGIRA